MAKRSSQATMRSGNGGAKQIPWWIWFLGGLFCGLGLSALVLMKQWAPQLRDSATATTSPAAPTNTPAPAEDKPKYDFYSVLPEMEVVVPDAEVKSAANAPVAATPTPNAGSGTQRFMLQAASFRSSADADTLKAKLTLMGVGAGVSVQAVNVNGTEYFRVRVGPFPDLRGVDAAKRTLESNGISAIALRENAP
ncbi:MAG: SPOR domain-containing protein [Rhodanobacteraceae bacterium]|nr:SPOR domain-containing protein [Rhodanobacteraceae bacterium]MBK7043708.1 SPOR domain-containing protein [Rhodanobacteraceae bacterium]MBP9154834.1 SPOR domain-containing protein [Xanthomonadales bacterium]HQW80794.1 SPOR domain-containing protein [Pseudomonadota bacterium]